MIRLFTMIALLTQPVLAQRAVAGQVVHSSALPELTIRVSQKLTYLGRLSYDVRDVAKAEEYVFGATGGGKLQRAFVAHFEQFLPTNDHFFEYPRLRMATLGQREYLHQTWALRQFDLFTVPAMQKFLRARNLTAEASWLVDRYVRVVDETRKHEVIFFYLEGASANPRHIHYGGSPFEPPPPPAPPPGVEAEFVSRARAAFQVSEP
jgi:hypothetical protein